MKKLFIFSVLVIVAAGFMSCKKEKSSEKDIIEFWVGDVQYNINGTNIYHLYPKRSKDVWTGWVSMPVAPKIALSPKADIKPSKTDPQNFENEVVYTVTAEDGSTKIYKVKAERTMYLD